MDIDSNRTQGVSLPQSTEGQNSPDSVTGSIGSSQQAAATGGPLVTPVIQLEDDSAKDEELDQEWVNKAKDIVEKTKADPFTQANELSSIKAEYLKTRFNKELNTGSKSSQ